MIATDFTRDDCRLGHRRVTYAALQREYRCRVCGGRVGLDWAEPCGEYPDGWRVWCRQCEAADFIHEMQCEREKWEADEVLAGLPAELVALIE